MSIVRDECNERGTRVDRMIDEFRKAQERRQNRATAAKSNDHVVELPGDGNAEAVAVARSTATPRTSE